MNSKVRIILSVVAMTFATYTFAQTKSQAFIDYIEKYKDLAIEQMERNKIPASITLAQGVLESAAGSSPLAQRSNNHFGIKCGSSWLGATTTHFDDGRNECFRVYPTVRDSYEDHSQFLKKERYMRLYRLNIMDYKGWARGLKACGYATSPTYADRLIAIIELYDLHRFDRDPDALVIIPEPEPLPVIELKAHTIRKNNDVMCVIANGTDTWDSLAKEMGVSKRKLLKCNEAEELVPLAKGDFVYLEKKKTKAAKEFRGDYWHHVTDGESMYSIAQKYGICLKNLYKLNFKDSDYVPVKGDLLRVGE